MKCSCELRFWVRKAISHLSSQQLNRKSGSCLPLWCLRPSALACPPEQRLRRRAAILLLSEAGGLGGRERAGNQAPWGPGGLARWEPGAAGWGALGERKAVFPLVLIGLCDSDGRSDSPSGSTLAPGSCRAPHLRHSEGARQLFQPNRHFWMVLGLEKQSLGWPGNLRALTGTAAC